MAYEASPGDQVSTVREFAIVAMQRSGTTVLTELLNSDARFYVATEIFHPGEDQRDSFLSFCAERFRTSAGGSLPQRRDLFRDFVHDLRAKAGAEIVGYNVKYGSCHNLDGDWRGLSQPPALFEILEMRGASIIHVIRTDVFKSALSNVRAAATNLWHFPAGGGVAIPRIEVDVFSLLRLIEFTHAEIETATKWLVSFPRLFTARYENMFDGDRFDRRFTESLAGFFGVEAKFSGDPKMKKLGAANWREDVANWREVEREVQLKFPRILLD